MDYSSTYRLAQDIRDSDEYKTYHELKETVLADETTAALIKDEVHRFIFDKIKRNPMILPIILDV